MSYQVIHFQVESSEGERTIRVQARADTVLTDILRREAVPLNTRCGQRGLCENCHVQLLAGRLVHRHTGETVTADGQPVAVQGCQYLPASQTAVVVRIPGRSLLSYQPQVVSDFRVNVPLAHNPLWQQRQIPDGHGGTVLDAARQVFANDQPISLAASVPKEAATNRSLWLRIERRVDGWQVTALADQAVARPLGVAIDLGTTTVAALLVDLNDGAVLGRAADFNRQMHLGDDVLTRINLCSTDPTMLDELQRAVVCQTIEPLLEQLLDVAAPANGQLVTLAVAGNTTMLHLLAGVDPTPMGVAPFTPNFLTHQTLTATQVHLKAPTSANKAAHKADPTVHLLPGATAYIGSDLTSGILGSGLLYEQGPSLLVDVGTNGEIILKHGEQLLGCATAAGPAFEGARLRSGVRAGAGAISHLTFQRDPALNLKYEVIGGGKPIGLCGSAYIDLLGEGRTLQLLSSAGRFNLDRFSNLSDRLEKAGHYGHALRIAYAAGKHPLLVTEIDIASLLQAKAAIAAGIVTLLSEVGLTAADVKTLYLAGGFGMHVNVENAIAAGLLPGFRPEQIHVVGNTSLGGAYLTLLDASALREISRAGNQMKVVELNLTKDFEACYIDQLCLP